MRFVVELYVLPGEDAAAAARAVVTDSARVVEAIGLPADEICFLVLEASRPADVAQLMQRAGLRVNRISPAVVEG